MRRRSLAALALLLATGLPAPGASQVYHWVDDDGTLHYASGLDRVPAAYRSRAAGGAVSSAPAPAAATEPVTIRITPGAPILVTARINGQGPVTLLLDTGADRTVVAPATLVRLGIAPSEGAVTEIQGVTGTAQAGVVQIESLEIGGLRAGPLSILAHDAGVAPLDGLLGRDVLGGLTVSIDPVAGTVTLAR